MDVFGAVVNIVLVAATLAVIWYARETVRESRRATTAAENTVKQAGEIVAAVRELVRVTRETVDVARAAREADERARLERQLRDLGELAERAFTKAAAEDGARPMAGWRCVEQQYIAVALVGVGVELPKCHTLAGSSQAGSVLAAAVDARHEIAEKLREPHATGQAEGGLSSR
jgi:hypothetical protein